MKFMFQSVGFITLFLFVSFKAVSQARLTINNNSMRSMTLKVMKGGGEKGVLHQTVTISAYGNETIYFSDGGYYFTKTKAVLKGKDPVYQKGQPFKVTNDDTGYSVLTLTFTIKESSVPQVTGGKKISKEEFDKN
ncbi:hypothetical protein [Lacibacter sediminis]|uniref:Uncharacterized protein n=1 Tax=Lacibacter sediminis TaxID=2760713 RepID=A0A7G5XFQ0_9BACT|nr:hypothetical protein [Lacibacter sediminis]QNA44303.1 hypothetical protein H4075_19910 [Lacibacter sediminis]